MNVHTKLYQEVEYIVEMNLQELKNKSIDELAEFKPQLKNRLRRIKDAREGYDKTKSFYRDSSNMINDLKEKIDEIKKVSKHKKKGIKKIENSPEKPKPEYYIIAELLATNKIEIKEKESFLYKGIKYESGTELGKIINAQYETNNKAFAQYLNDFKSRTGEKYFLKTSNIENNLDETNIRILKKLYQYFSNHQIKVTNKNFLDSFKILEAENLI